MFCPIWPSYQCGPDFSDWIAIDGQVVAAGPSLQIVPQQFHTFLLLGQLQLRGISVGHFQWLPPCCRLVQFFLNSSDPPLDIRAMRPVVGDDHACLYELPVCMRTNASRLLFGLGITASPIIVEASGGGTIRDNKRALVSFSQEDCPSGRACTGVDS